MEGGNWELEEESRDQSRLRTCFTSRVSERNEERSSSSQQASLRFLTAKPKNAGSP
ncbi:uncharacterized protein G2W53_002314 [Senna tora]|uniref:Uncharacterized protein n=1 Tax=Senna tora TaxID=362788 RepID=A0A834XHL6_9FABA|nr:uncharacterized protein G2W53_002314 [Senna tora]